MKINKKIFLSVLGIIVLLTTCLLGYGYTITSTGFDIESTKYIYIGAEKNYEKLLDDINTIGKVEDINSFKQVASFMNYPQAIKTGKYSLEAEMTVLDLVRKLKRGEQTPVRVTFNNIRTKDDLSTRLSEQLMFSKEELDKVLNDEATLADFGFNDQTIPSMFIPNTYEFYWDVSVNTFCQRMNKEYKRFWTEPRLEKAKAIDLSPTEVSVLASIVEEECTFGDEYPTVAGLYINRLKRGQKLQADPTVKFAVGDFTLRRILFSHLEVDSPYNTYQNAGLPPGPIRIPSIKGLDAVLNYANHNYLYMCAKDDFSGRHNFAVTHAQHERNAQLYRSALNRNKIY